MRWPEASAHASRAYKNLGAHATTVVAGVVRRQASVTAVPVSGTASLAMWRGAPVKRSASPAVERRADAGAVAVGVRDHPERRRLGVADERAAGVEDRLQPPLALVVGHPHVEVPALLGVLRRAGRTRRRSPAPGTTRPAPGRSGRRARRPSPRRRGARRRRRRAARARPVSSPGSSCGEPGASALAPSSAANPLIRAGEVDVATGDAADVVAAERDDDLGVGQRDVRVVVGLVGGGADAVDEGDARSRSHRCGSGPGAG